jgi:hypothetical protein
MDAKNLLGYRHVMSSCGVLTPGVFGWYRKNSVCTFFIRGEDPLEPPAAGCLLTPGRGCR